IPDGARRNTTREPSGDTTRLRGAPRLNRSVRALRRAKLSGWSLMPPILTPAPARVGAMSADRRLLLVHAHPDDEVLNTGATMAMSAATGAAVTLITCTLGEEGEILLPELAHLAADRTDGLGKHRIGELAAAMQALGVADQRFLGGPGRYR